EGKSFSDFAILARANAHLEPFIAAFKRHELPFQIVGNRGLFEQEEVALLLAVLRVVADPQDYSSWYQVLNIPAFKLPAQDVLAFINEVKKEHVSVEEALAERAPQVLEIIQKIVEDSRRISPSHLLFDFVQESGYVEEFVKAPTVENQLKIENISLFFQKIHQYEGEVRSPNVPELVDYLDMLTEAGESPAQAVVEDVDTVNLMTVHAAKGLEFPVVFLVSLTSDRFPTRRRGGAIELPEPFIKELKTADWKGMDPAQAERLGHMQEERRLFYVGVTRAREQVFLSFAQNYGGVRDKRPSPFIHELGVEVPKEPEDLFLLQPLKTDEIRELADREIDVQSLIPAKFSYSQLEDYKSCPWKYRYKYIFKIPAAPAPPLSFGISMHEALREFEMRLMHGEKPTREDLLKIYQEHFSSQGYRDKKEKAAYFKQGKRMLTDFYRKGMGKLASPFMVEKSFEVKIGNQTVAGRIDRVGKDAEGNFELVDFKTGAAEGKDPKELAKRAKSSDQLALYTIAAREALGINPKRIGLFYLDSGILVEVELTEKELAKRQGEMQERIAQIRQGSFKATPGPHCVWCPFNNICPHSQADRYR
ncbi:MAG: ATP-dependent DNA helicase, partial [bacterium]|nr:ATP-dependent DNA helicase [bacterium]